MIKFVFKRSNFNLNEAIRRRHLTTAHQPQQRVVVWTVSSGPASTRGASITHERAMKTREPSCVPRVVNPFFISAVHNPSGAVEHVAAPELTSHEGRAPSHGTRGSTGAPLLERQSSKT
jgi:hypothetical protein